MSHSGMSLSSALLIIAVPAAAFSVGAYVFSVVSKRTGVAESLGRSEFGKPLYKRWRGYSLEDLHLHWSALGERAQGGESLLLIVDLFFPLLYGGALLYTLYELAYFSGLFAYVALFLAPAVLAMVADWLENSLLLSQFGRYRDKGKPGLDDAVVRFASGATQLKFFALAIVAVFLAYLLWEAVTRY